MRTFPKPLTAEEERYYLHRLRQGDREARRILIEYNLRLVAHITKKYQSAEDDMEELISIGTIGLMQRGVWKMNCSCTCGRRKNI